MRKIIRNCATPDRSKIRFFKDPYDRNCRQRRNDVSGRKGDLLVIGDADSSIKINISASTGSSGNVHSLQDGSIDLGLVSGDIAFSAVNGTGEFKDHEFKDLKVIAALYPSLSNWMARDDSGIFYVHDLKGNRLGVGPQDSTTELAAKVSWALSESPTRTPPSSTVVSDQALTRLKTGRSTRSMDLPGCRSPGLQSWQTRFHAIF